MQINTPKHIEGGDHGCCLCHLSTHVRWPPPSSASLNKNACQFVGQQKSAMRKCWENKKKKRTGARISGAPRLAGRTGGNTTDSLRSFREKDGKSNCMNTPRVYIYSKMCDTVDNAKKLQTNIRKKHNNKNTHKKKAASLHAGPPCVRLCVLSLLLLGPPSPLCCLLLLLLRSPP